MLFGLNVLFNNLSVISQRCLVAKWVSMLTVAIFTGLLNTVRDVIVLPHSGIKFQPLYLIPPQSPNTDTGRPVLALPTNASVKRVATSTIGLSWAEIRPSTS